MLEDSFKASRLTYGRIKKIYDQILNMRSRKIIARKVQLVELRSKDFRGVGSLSDDSEHSIYLS